MLGLLATTAAGQDRGFRVPRDETAAAGSETFLVDRPWYSGTRRISVAVLAGYSHRVLESRGPSAGLPAGPILDHALEGQLQVAAALLDRLQLSAAMPVSFLELGTSEPLSHAAPLRTVSVGDPRVGVTVRLLGQADRDALSIHVGAEAWIPIGASARHLGDAQPRLLPRAVLAGTVLGRWRWLVEAGFLLRAYSSLGPPELGMTAASEARLGLALGASLLDGRLTLGPEARFATQVFGANAWASSGQSLEVLVAVQYLLGGHLAVGLAGGTSFLGAPGAPDARAQVRLAWAPRSPEAAVPHQDQGPTPPEEATPTRAAVPPGGTAPGSTATAGATPGGAMPGGAAPGDADGDGVPDALDRCPFEAETPNGYRDDDGCPELVGDAGAPLLRVLAPRTNPPPPARSPAPDAGTPLAGALPAVDSDEDGVLDALDRCPAAPEDLDGFEDDDGCPEPDNDGDRILDAADRCPMEAETFNGLDDDDGCPDVAPDEDGDGVADAVDRCPLEPENRDGVRDDDGCPELPSPTQTALARFLAPPPAPSAKPGPGTPPLAVPTPALRDADGDGLTDDVDRCPATPEDRDGFEDEDGCPELDDDGDGVLDAKDQCPDAAEVVNGWKDDDGCPDEEADVDHDGVDYDHDRCPLEPGVQPDGCPRTPAPALAAFGLAPLPASASAPPSASASASPNGDLDGDRVPDAEDRCPGTAEDRDDFEDDDGCPEPDNDLDGIPDLKDRCPFDAETINGVADDDGCPDVGTAAVFFKSNKVVFTGTVRFRTGSAALDPTSFPLLKQVAAVLKAAASVSVEIQGHTDDVGNAAANIKLSKQRAQTIRAFMTKAGVAAGRLTAVGYGPTRPRASNKTADGREQNRRVEFVILGESK